MAELTRLAIEDYDPGQEREQPYLLALRDRGDEEVLRAMEALTRSGRPEERALAADVLGGFGRQTLARKAGNVLLEMIASEEEPIVLTAIGFGLGRLQDGRAVQPLARLSSHSDDDVRLAVAYGLLTREDDAALKTLVELSGDSDDTVRDWATFGLGSQVEVEREDVCQALRDRLTDENDSVRREAAIGLARRGDPSAVEEIVEIFDPSADDAVLEEAVILLADKIDDLRVEALMKQVARRWSPEAIAAALGNGSKTPRQPRDTPRSI